MRKLSRVVILLTFACAFLALGVSNAAAQVQLGMRGAGVTLGFVDPEEADAALAIGLFLDAGRVGSNLAVEPYMDFWMKSEDTLGGGEASARDIALGAKGKWLFTPIGGNEIQPYAGLGLGAHFTKVEVTLPDFGLPVPTESISDSAVKLGLDFGGGMQWPVSSVELRAEMWYSIVSDWSQLSARFGVMWPFGG